MEDEAKTFREYFASFNRHKLLVICISGALLAICAAITVAIPPTYRSSAVVLVKEQELPPELARLSTVTSFADERFLVIGQRVLTREVLLPLVKKYALYRNYRARANEEDVVYWMRRDITVSTVDTRILEQGSGRGREIAFRISYDSPYPDKSQKVVNDLVALYINENIRERQARIAGTTTFLVRETSRLGEQVKMVEEKRAGFKRRYTGRTPDLLDANKRMAERIQTELLSLRQNISNLQDRKLSMAAQLALIQKNSPSATGSGDKLLTPEEQIRMLQTEYTRGSAFYGPNHPDMLRIQREMAALEALFDKSVVNIPNNPAYISLAAALDNANRELERLFAQQDELQRMQRSHDTLLMQMPEIEREYSDLMRDYDTTKNQYHSMRAKLTEAELAQALEKERTAERFSVSEPASLPGEPFRPNRVRIAAVGFVSALGVALGLAWLMDTVDPAVKGLLELKRATRVPILMSIPYVETKSERQEKRRRIWLIGLATAVTTTIFIALLVLIIRYLL